MWWEKMPAQWKDLQRDHSVRVSTRSMADSSIIELWSSQPHLYIMDHLLGFIFPTRLTYLTFLYGYVTSSRNMDTCIYFFTSLLCCQNASKQYISDNLLLLSCDIAKLKPSLCTHSHFVVVNQPLQSSAEGGSAVAGPFSIVRVKPIIAGWISVISKLCPLHAGGCLQAVLSLFTISCLHFLRLNL